MNPWLWLEIFILVVLLYFVLLLVDHIYQAGTGKTKLWWKRHIIDDCTWPDECFDCDRGDCLGCDVLLKATLKPQGGK
jgi:hypothetical protein